MKLYSALYKEFEPLNIFYPEFERVVVTRHSNIQDPGILIIWGGSDIHPQLYGRKNEGSYVSNSPSMRDEEESILFLKAQKAGIGILGVCRGAQLGCAMSGGILIQDVSGHGHSHRVTTIDGDSFITSSLHHQMMYPWDIEHKLLAWTQTPLSHEYRGITDEEYKKIPRRIYEETKSADIIEPEIVYFPGTKCLAVQGHPEMMSPNSQHNLFMKKYIDEFFLHTT